MSERKLTVLQLLPSLESGGVERGTIEISKALCDAGHHSIVISNGGRLVAELDKMGAEHIQWDIGKKSLLSLKYVFRLRRYLRKNNIDILHARSRFPAWIAWLAWQGLNKQKRPRFVTTVHGLYSVKKYSSIMTRGEKVIAVSDTIRKYMLDNYLDVDEKKIQVIYRGVDPVEFPYGYNPDSDWLNKWYEQYPQLKDHHVITLPGRLTRLKGHADFIDLVSFLREKKVDVYGLIVGGDDPKRQAYAKEIRDKVKESGMQDRIIFTGLRSDMREIYAVSDLVLSLSTKPESFGRTSLEALSIGRPLVGYDQGGVGELLHNIYPQGCVSCGDRGALQEMVKNMLTQPCVVPAHHDYLLARMLSDTLRLYANLAGST